VARLEGPQSSTGPYAAARRDLVSGDPVVMLQYTHPAASHVTAVRTMPQTSPFLIPHLPTKARAQPALAAAPQEQLHGSQQTSARSSCSHPPLASEHSDLSSVEGDLRMQLHGTVLTANELFRDDIPREEERTPQLDFAWQRNPEFSPGQTGVFPCQRACVLSSVLHGRRCVGR
jgi:hypothetical protein